ncbi:hypothetical protein FRC07_003158, partial [Ceratobasidium sp. 392]
LTDTGATIPQTLVPSSRSRSGVTDDSSPDPREIDCVFNKLTTMAGRQALFRRFIVDQIEASSLPRVREITKHLQDDLTPSAPPTPETPAAVLNLFFLSAPLSKVLDDPNSDTNKPDEPNPDDPHQCTLMLVAKTGSTLV